MVTRNNFDLGFYSFFNVKSKQSQMMKIQGNQIFVNYDWEDQTCQAGAKTGCLITIDTRSDNWLRLNSSHHDSTLRGRHSHPR